MTKIMGVDFSGAGSDDSVGKTWMAQGWLDGSTLTIKSCCPISRTALTNELAGLTEPAVVAMDFPFSVPAEFANYWQRSKVLDDGWEMPNLWVAAAHLTLRWDKFKDLQLALRLEKFKREPKRSCDPPESFSPLHTTNPNMVPMTFRGMAMLHDLWGRLPHGTIWVPPLPEPPGYNITLMEVMPGATLRSFGLPHTGYKNTPRLTTQQKKQRKDMRRHILGELPQRINPLTVNLTGDVYDRCLNDDDALDSVVAAITAALWVIDRERFINPPEQGHPDYPQVRLEGWLYIPRRRCPNCGELL